MTLPATQEPSPSNRPLKHRWKRALEPVERLSEVLFGLIMALSITGSLSVAGGGESDVQTLLVGAIGCNTAWGIVDGIMYLLTTLVERHRGRALLLRLRAGASVEEGRAMIADRLPPVIAETLPASDLDGMRARLVAMPAVPSAGLTGRDLLGAVAVFLLVFVSTLPVVVPFLLPIEPHRALRWSNGVAILLLFVIGHRFGRYAFARPALMGLAMVGLGVLLVGLTIALGG